MGVLFSIYASLALLAGYLLGSHPLRTAADASAGLGDVRNIGSGNIGATNVLRTGHKGLGRRHPAARPAERHRRRAHRLRSGQRFVAFDAFQLAYLAGLGAFLGHLFPVWLGFQGGKGVATFIGVLLGVHWPAALVFGLVWLAVAAVWRYSSLATLSGTAGVIVYYLIFGQAGLLVPDHGSAILVKHHANIRRLLDGAEARIGAKP